MSETTGTTKRDEIVRRACRDLGILLGDAAREMGWATLGSMNEALTSSNPRGPTLERIRVWLRRRKVRRPDGGFFTNADLAG